jgi:hypothetical protein
MVQYMPLRDRQRNSVGPALRYGEPEIGMRLSTLREDVRGKADMRNCSISERVALGLDETLPIIEHRRTAPNTAHRSAQLGSVGWLGAIRRGSSDAVDGRSSDLPASSRSYRLPERHSAKSSSFILGGSGNMVSIPIATWPLTFAVRNEAL